MAAFFPNWLPSSNSFLRRGGAPSPSHIVAVASSLRLGRLLRESCAADLGFLLLLNSPHPSSFPASERFDLDDGPITNKQIWDRKMMPLLRFSPFETVSDSLLRSCSRCFAFFFGGTEDGKGHVDRERMRPQSPKGKPFGGRLWTNVLLAINVLVYAAQIATQGKLLLWGAKVNYLIDKGQIWRLVTSSFLHANIGHLMINCYSLNSIGPTVEQLSGPRRFLAIYFGSAITSSLMSYNFCQSSAVGASGAIFGLVGSFTVFILRHRSLTIGGNDDLRHIAHVIALNMAIGFLFRRVDNWGHLGGLLGGMALSWLLGPAWQYQFRSLNGRLVFTDKAPIFSLFNRGKPC